MSAPIHKIIELVGTSKTSVSDAISSAIAEAGKTIRDLEWFEVGEVRGSIDHDKVSVYQVTLKVGFRLER